MRGNVNSYTTEFRQYDPRVGRWLSLDPMMAQFPWQSPYVGFDDNPVVLNDPAGSSTEDWVGTKNADGTETLRYDPNITRPDQVGAGESFYKNGTIVKNTEGAYVRLGENAVLPSTETDYMASRGVFVPGKYYTIGQYG